MKYLYSLLAASVLFTSCSSSKKTAAVSPQASLYNFTLLPLPQNKIIIDGDLSEWNTNVSFKDNYSTMTSIISADSSTIYIALRIDEPWMQMKLLQMGMQIYFDTTENESMKHFVAYPVMPQNMDGNISAKNNSVEKKTLMKQAIILQTNGMMLTQDGMHEAYNTGGIRAAMKTDITNNLTYELAVPLADIYGANYLQHLNSVSSLNIGFVINGMPKEENSGQGVTMSQMQNAGQGSGRMHNGGGGQGGSHGGQYNNSKSSYSSNYTTKDLTAPTNLWVKATW